MSDVRQGLFDLLKGIIDDEWGPYDDDYYWAMVDEELPKLGLMAEHRTCQDGSGGVSSRCNAAGRIVSTTHSGRTPTGMRRYVTAWEVSREAVEFSRTTVHDDPIAITSQQ